MSTYVIGDVHGCFDELMTLIKNIEAQDKDAKYILTGDMLDRGPKNVEMAKWAIEHIFKDKSDKYQSVRGNHDAGILSWIKARRYGYRYGYEYGTEYDFDTEEKELLLITYAEFTKRLPLYIEKIVNGKTFVISHGYVPKEYKEYNPYSDDEDICSLFYWDRSALYGAESPFDDITIVCGHNPVILPEWIECHPNHEICTVYIGNGLVNVDMGCFHSGLLGAYCLETGEVFYSGKPGIEGFKERKNI